LRTIVDTSVAVKWYFEESGHAAADAILEAQIAGERDLLAPDLVVPEFANVLWKKTRRGECSSDDAVAILDLWETDRPELVPSSELAARALALASALDHSVYDCLYLATAIELDAAFATADRQLARAARTVLAEVELIR
jgi:predicted nucleic acid-binding protein